MSIVKLVPMKEPEASPASLKISKDTGCVEGENVAIEYGWAESSSIDCRRSRMILFARGGGSSRWLAV
jgi:hypothetical protein